MLFFALLLPACAPDEAAAPPDPIDLASPDAGWLRGDLHFHTNYSDDAREQGGDWMAGALTIAAAWSAPEWVAANPSLAPDDHLQFVAVTDHRTVVGLSDPDFHHPGLVVLGGEEFGSDGHAGIWGLATHVPHEPQSGESPAERIADAIDEAHGQGALFSVNHPTYAGDLWTWPVDAVDGVEIWNGPWSLGSSETTEAELDQWLADKGGEENAVIRAAIAQRGGGQNAQALRFWQAMLSLGLHTPPVGGGDRHLIFPAGLPTTYVAAPSPDPAGVLAGLAAGSTFVSRSPQGPQVLLEAEVGGQTFPMGAALPSGPVTVSWRVGRADGGTLRFVEGRIDPTLPAPTVLAELPLDGEDAAGTFAWTPPAGGGWLHAIVTDPLPTPEDAEMEAVAEALLAPAEDSPLGLVGALGGLVDPDTLGSPQSCHAEHWEPHHFWCMPADTEPLGSTYVPTALQPWLAIEREDGAATGQAMGAISAAFLVRAD